jgi:hypothetical protein
MAVDEHECAVVQHDGPSTCGFNYVVAPDVDRMSGGLPEIIDHHACAFPVGPGIHAYPCVHRDAVMMLVACKLAHAHPHAS